MWAALWQGHLPKAAARGPLLACCRHAHGNAEHPTSAANASDALRHPDYFDLNRIVRLNQLFANRVHLGHKANVRNPFMKPYLFGQRLDVDIIDLEQTKHMMRRALNFLAHTAYRGGVVLFISQHAQTLPLVERVALQCGEYAHCRAWQEGLFTNSRLLFGSTIRLPDVCVFVDALDGVAQPHPAIAECARMLVPTIGVVDTNADPRLLTYPIAGNDDTPCAVALYLSLFRQAIEVAKRRAIADAEALSGAERRRWSPPTDQPAAVDF